MGTMAIQFAKLSNYEVITTCSEGNSALCRSYGADHVFDYKDPDAPGQIKAIARNSLKICVDCISTEATAEFCAKVLSPGGKYSSINLSECPRDDVELVKTVGYTFLGEEYTFLGQVTPASSEDFEFSKAFAGMSEQLLKQRKIRSHPIDLRPGGLAAIPAALEELRAKRISGAKIVVRV